RRPDLEGSCLVPEAQAVVQRELPRVYLHSSPGQGLSEPLIASRSRPSLTQRFRFALKALQQFLVAVPRLSPSLWRQPFQPPGCGGRYRGAREPAKLDLPAKAVPPGSAE